VDDGVYSSLASRQKGATCCYALRRTSWFGAGTFGCSAWLLLLLGAWWRRVDVGGKLAKTLSCGRVSRSCL